MAAQAEVDGAMSRTPPTQEPSGRLMRCPRFSGGYPGGVGATCDASCRSVGGLLAASSPRSSRAPESWLRTESNSEPVFDVAYSRRMRGGIRGRELNHPCGRARACYRPCMTLSAPSARAFDLRIERGNDVLERVERSLRVRLDRNSVVRKRRSVGARTHRDTWVRIEWRSPARGGSQD